MQQGLWGVLLILALGFGPALAWFWFFARRDKHPEPVALLARTFFWGAALMLPTGLLEGFLSEQFGSWIGYVVAGPLEESAKLMAATSIVGRKEFDEPIDGLVYATAAALGFSTLENILYMLQYGPGLIVVRGTLSTFAHVLFAMPWGFALAQQRFGQQKTGLLLLRGWALGVVFHALYNLLLIGGDVRELVWLMLPLPAVLFVMYRLSNRYFERLEQEFGGQELNGQGFFEHNTAHQTQTKGTTTQPKLKP